MIIKSQNILTSQANGSSVLWSCVHLPTTRPGAFSHPAAAPNANASVHKCLMLLNLKGLGVSPKHAGKPKKGRYMLIFSCTGESRLSLATLRIIMLLVVEILRQPNWQPLQLNGRLKLIAAAVLATNPHLAFKNTKQINDCWITTLAQLSKNQCQLQSNEFSPLTD